MLSGFNHQNGGNNFHNNNNNNNAPKRKHPNVIYTEMQISMVFSGAYDQPKETDPDEDEEDVDDEIRRILQDWYLTVHDKRKAARHRTNCTCRRLPMPIGNYQFVRQPGDHKDHYKDCVLAGWLQPAPPENGSGDVLAEPIFVELTDLEEVVVDCHLKEYRGVWVRTANATYWLHRPDNYSDVQPSHVDNTGPHASTSVVASTSQAELHLPVRVGLGVLSNLLDLITEDEDFLKMSIQQVYKHFLQKKQHEDGNEDYEPFDMDMLGLEECRKLVHDHLIRSVVTTEECTLFQTIADFPTTRTLAFQLQPPAPNSLIRKKNSGNPLASKVTAEMLVRSAERAEARSWQHPWGQPLGAGEQPPKVSTTKIPFKPAELETNGNSNSSDNPDADASMEDGVDETNSTRSGRRNEFEQETAASQNRKRSRSDEGMEDDDRDGEDKMPLKRGRGRPPKKHKKKHSRVAKAPAEDHRNDDEDKADEVVVVDGDDSSSRRAKKNAVVPKKRLQSRASSYGDEDVDNDDADGSVDDDDEDDLDQEEDELFQMTYKICRDLRRLSNRVNNSRGRRGKRGPNVRVTIDVLS